MWLIFLLFYPVNSIPYPKERCTMTDCSRQLHPFQNGSCVIHSTSVCKYSMSNFTQSSEVVLKDEAEAEFSIAITPYIAEIYSNPITFALSAINITLVLHGKGVSALAVKITKQNSIICRIFDFQSLERNFSFPINFFYDCFYDLRDYQNAQMDVIGLPMNNLLSYFVYIPPSHLSNLISSCLWKPVIMVFQGQLSNGIVIVKFSQAPQQFNISFYLVELINNSSKHFFLRVPSNEEMDMLSATFYSVSSGYYSTIVTPMDQDKSCNGTELRVFQVLNSKPGLDTLTVICICIVVLFTCCFFVIYKIGAKSIQLKLSEKQALLVLSHDCQEHKEFANSLVDYFSQKCHLDVSTIYNPHGPLSNGQSAEKWREDRYDESDVIIFLISEGLLVTLDEEAEDLRQIKVFHPWKTQLQDTSKYIFRNISKDLKSKKICKLRFPYSSQLRIPKRLDRKTGKCFLLPQQMNKFLHFVHDCHSAIPCVHPSLCQDLKSSKVGEMLLQKMEAVQEKVNNNLHVEYEPNRIPNKNRQETNVNMSFMIEGEGSQVSKEYNEICKISLCESLNFSETSEESSANEDGSLLNIHNFNINFDKHISNFEDNISDSNEHISNSDENISDSDEETRKFRLKLKNESFWKDSEHSEHE